MNAMQWHHPGRAYQAPGPGARRARVIVLGCRADQVGWVASTRDVCAELAVQWGVSPRTRYNGRASRGEPVKARTDAEWLAALKSSGDEQSAALEDLRVYLLRAATYSLHRNRGSLSPLSPADIAHLADDCAQDSLLVARGSAWRQAHRRALVSGQS
jgi:hypothetical protein